MPVAAVDFGTHTSGVVWGPSDDTITENFHYSNKAIGGGYAKTKTAFLVSKSLLNKIDDLSDDDIIPSDQEDKPNTNIWLGDIAQEKYLDLIQSRNDQTNDWIYFDHFKMSLYNKNSVVKGTDECEYSLEKIITLFLRCLKILFFNKNISDEISRESVKWGVTIPTIWDEDEKRVMKTAAIKAFNQEPIFILEPEGAAISFALQQHDGKIDPACMELNDRFLVIDCGGGTTDIVAMNLTVENHHAEYKELTEAKGRAAAGRDIDDRFWELFAQKIAEKDPNRFGDSYTVYVNSFKKGNLAGWHKMEKNWLDIKHRSFLSDAILFDFEIPYVNWMQSNHPDAIKKFNTGIGYSVTFTKKEIEEKVFKPVVDEIIKVAQESAPKASNLDYIFLAGGLSGLSYLQNAVRESFSQSHPNSRVLFEARSDHANALPGGSIMRGAATILVFDKLIRRVAKRNYYYEVFSDFCDEAAMEYRIEAAGGEWTDARRVAFQAERNRITPICKKDSSGNTLTHIFVPICCKGAPASLYKAEGIIPMNKYQNSVEFEFFSSDMDVFFYRERDPHIRKEGMIVLPCSSDSEFEIEIDFNEFQQANLFANITNTKTSECKKVALTVEVQAGH